jgi:uncharacterized membrane protein
VNRKPPQSLRATGFDYAVNILSLLILIGTCLYLIAIWQTIPDQIPVHYNAAGQVDRMGSKGSVVALPVVAWGMYIGITILEKFPRLWNTGVAVTAENSERVYRVLKQMIGGTKLLMVAVFACLSLASARGTDLCAWFTPVSLILIFGFIGFSLWRLFQVA